MAIWGSLWLKCSSNVFFFFFFFTCTCYLYICRRSFRIPYNRKYWRELYLAVGPHGGDRHTYIICKYEILAGFNLAVDGRKLDRQTANTIRIYQSSTAYLNSSCACIIVMLKRNESYGEQSQPGVANPSDLVASGAARAWQPMTAQQHYQIEATPINFNTV